VRLRQELESEGIPGSRAIRALHRLVEMHDWQHNIFFLIVSLPFLWGTHVAWAIETWRRVNGRRIRRWLTAVGEIEALASLSAYRYEHPHDPFPTILPNRDGEEYAALFDGASLGHPLLPAAQMVRNDVSLAGGAQLLVVSGSNMSGKSTLLRTAGVNAVLALAGAPRFASRTRCRRGAPASTRRSHGFASWPISRADPCRCSSCSTSCSMVRTPMTA
jgi:hypothetical protein